jgi:hypothetical protein
MIGGLGAKYTHWQGGRFPSEGRKPGPVVQHAKEADVSKERLIYRPKEIPPDVWEAMPREEQIRWWKDHQSPPRPKTHMKQAISQYGRGIITERMFSTVVAKLAVMEEIEEFVRECPPELMAVLKKDLAEYDADEAKWPRSFSIRCYAPWVTPEEIRDSQRREQERIWDGVRLLKKYLP